MDKSASATLQNIFVSYGREYRKKHKLPYESHKVMNAIQGCRTEKLGYHLISCGNCGCDYEKKAYNSCRDRHCPQCQSYQSAKWVLERKAELLPVPYFHVTFTIPHELNSLVLWNKELLYDLLFKAAWESAAALIGERRHFNGQGGAVAVLHTWGQNLMEHPHVHMIVPGGALRWKSEWVQKNLKRKKNGKKKKEFLVPIVPLQILFKNKFLVKLAKLYKKGELMLPPKADGVPGPKSFYRLKDAVYKKTWNINIKEPFASPEDVLKYLGRYTHRAAISNARILNIENGRVTFVMKDYRNNGKKVIRILDAHEFIRRFLLHVLPKGFRRIRMFGFLANRYKIRNLEVIRKLLEIVPVKIEKANKTVQHIMQEFFGVNILKCPQCGRDSLKVIQVHEKWHYAKGFG